MPEETFKINAKLIGVLVTVALFLLAQTGAALWWASGVSTSLTFIHKDVAELKDTLKTNTAYRYTSLDAQQDKKMFLDQIDTLKQRVMFNDGRIADLQTRVTVLEKQK